MWTSLDSASLGMQSPGEAHLGACHAALAMWGSSVLLNGNHAGDGRRSSREASTSVVGNQSLAPRDSQEAPGCGRGTLTQHALPCWLHLPVSEMGARSPEHLSRSLAWITVNVQEAI